MRKCLLLILLAALLCPLSISGAENANYLALTFAGCPAEGDAARLMDGLESRGVRGTFFLRPEDCPRSDLLRQAGQELGILTDVSPALSRREMAKEITDIREGMPGNTRVRFLIHKNRDSAGFRQVSRALGLVILDPSENWEQAADGDIVLLDAGLPAAEILYQIDWLQRRGFSLVTVSELARLRGVSLHSGDCCRRIPRR